MLEANIVVFFIYYQARCSSIAFWNIAILYESCGAVWMSILNLLQTKIFVQDIPQKDSPQMWTPPLRFKIFK